MLSVQGFLRSGRTLEDLKEQLGITAKEHEDLDLVILNYNQIDSPKTHPIVKECRGLVLEKGTWNIVAKSFDRFFNLGEDIENTKDFNWNNFEASEKIDGSLIIVYFYNYKWFINTRGTFGYTDELNYTGKSWDDHIRPLLQDKFDLMDKSCTYVFEFVSLHNKIVRIYKNPDVFLLTIFKKINPDKYVELDTDEIERHANKAYLTRSKRLEFKSLEDIEKYLTCIEETDPTNEGVVIKDDAGMRLKIKSKTYLALHRMHSNNGPSPKNILPFVLSGEKDELLSYFPEYSDEYYNVESKVQSAYNTLIKIWEENWKIESQKDFALAIIKETPFNGILFDLRKRFGNEQKIEELTETWRKSADLILKILFK